MNKYYFIGTILPPLSFELPPEISFADFARLLQDNLSDRDFQKVLIVRRYFDILNIKAFWQGEELNPYGTLDENELGEGLLDEVTFPSYIYDFLGRHESTEDRLNHFPALLSKFFTEEVKKCNGIVRDYLEFEREYRLVFTGFRSNKLGRDLSFELQYEDPEEDFIAQMLAQRDSKVYEPPEKYQDLKILFDQYGDAPMDLQKALAQYRYNYLDQLVDMADTFSIERILVYMMQLIIVEKWFALDKARGVEIVSKMMKEIS